MSPPRCQEKSGNSEQADGKAKLIFVFDGGGHAPAHTCSERPVGKLIAVFTLWYEGLVAVSGQAKQLSSSMGIKRVAGR